MEVRLLTDRAGRGFYQREGEVYDLPDDEATALIRTKQAEAMVRTAPEAAMQRHAKKTRR